MKMKNQACDNFLTNSNLSVKKSVVRLILLSYLTLMTLDLQGMMKVARVESASEGQQEVPSEYEKNLDPNVRAQAAQQQAASALGVKLPFSFSASVRAFFSKIGRNPEAVAESLQNASPSRVAKMQEYLTRMNKFTDVGIMRGMKAAFAKFKARMSGSASDKANAGSQFAVDLSGSGGSLDHVASLVATAEGSDVSVKSSDGLQILSDPTASSLLSTSDPATASLVENLHARSFVEKLKKKSARSF